MLVLGSVFLGGGGGSFGGVPLDCHDFRQAQKYELQDILNWISISMMAFKMVSNHSCHFMKPRDISIN